MHSRAALPCLLLFLAACGGGSPGGNTPPPGPGPGVDEVPVGDPGARTVARLNRTQYNNTVRDVLGTAKRPADVFPFDESANGFDNQGAALTTTSTHVELWELAADTVLDEMFGRVSEETVRYGVQVEDAGVFYSGIGQPFGLTGYTLVDGSLTVTQSLAYDGVFEVTAFGFGRAADGEDPELAIEVDGIRIGTVDIDAVQSAPAEFTLQVELTSGVHSFEFSIDNPYDDGFGTRRNLTIDWVEINGPLDPEGALTDAYGEFAGCAMDENPDAGCAREAVAAFGERLWRRPLTAAEIDWAVSLYDTAVSEGEDGSWSLQFAFKGLMLSPEFLYHIESDVAEGEGYRALDGYEVADRLATFLWASTPDEDLLAAAGSGEYI